MLRLAGYRRQVLVAAPGQLRSWQCLSPESMSRHAPVRNPIFTRLSAYGSPRRYADYRRAAKALLQDSRSGNVPGHLCKRARRSDEQARRAVRLQGIGPSAPARWPQAWATSSSSAAPTSSRLAGDRAPPALQRRQDRSGWHYPARRRLSADPLDPGSALRHWQQRSGAAIRSLAGSCNCSKEAAGKRLSWL